MLQRKFYWLMLVIISAWIAMDSWVDTARANSLAETAQATATPTKPIAILPTVTPTVAPTATQTVSFDAPLPALRLSFSNNGQTLTGSYTLTVDTLPAAPAGTHFELWVQDAKGKMLKLGRVAVSSNDVVFTDETNQELLATYDSAFISLEMDGREVTTPSQVIYSGSLPSALLSPLRVLYFGQAFAGIGALAGAVEQSQIASSQSLLLVEALDDDDLVASSSYAEHVLNVLDGATGDYYGDLDRDGLVQNPGDGYGLANYFNDLVAELTSLSDVVVTLPDAEGTIAQTAQMLSDASAAQALVIEAEELAYDAFLAASIKDAQPSAENLLATVQEIETLADDIFAMGLQVATIELAALPPNSQTSTPEIAPTSSLTATEPLTGTDTVTPTATLTPTVRSASVLTSTYWVNPVDGAEYVYVPAGEFQMGAEAGTGVPAKEQPLHPVTTSAFWIQRTEVTNAQYALCVTDGACTPPKSAGWDEPAQAQYPVAFVNWQQANDYAAWAGGRLPSEAEWEKACRSDDARIYPWGDDAATAELANFDNQLGASSVVGSYPDGASPYDALDMSGNVWEWTTSLEELYPYVADDGREDPDAEGKRVARGGSFYYTQYQLHCSSRLAAAPTTSNDQTGFRVVVAVEAAYWVNPIDGAEYVYVPAGEFQMGANAGTGVPAKEQPLHPVTTNAFWIQRTEVTNAQYALCVMDGACTVPSSAGWDSQSQAEHPVAFVNWQQANDYAAWAEGRLPSEAEWEKACRGDDARIYPWGDDAASAELANFDNQLGASSVVGSYPDGASPYDALDMSGNVWEWTTSLEELYPYVADDGREDPNAEGKRVARGGSFYYTQYQLHCSSRLAAVPTTSNDQTGFRVIFVP